MKRLKHLALVLSSIFLLAACQKEYSLETGSIGGNAQGTLRDSLGDCQPVELRGLFFTDSTLTDANYVNIQATITVPGAYVIATDVQNGYSFKDSGFFASAGVYTIQLKASGRPVLPVTSDFTVSFNNGFCLFSVPVLPRTTGPNAVYTLSGNPNNCTNAVVQGTYTAGTTLNSTNNVSIEVNVTALGRYVISTPQTNGISFAASGTFSALGVQSIILQGSGTPTNGGATTIPITAGGTTCSFTVNVEGGSGGNINLSDSAWQFTQGTATYHGTLDSVVFSNVSGIDVLQFYGLTFATGDTSFVLGIGMTSNTIQSGTYNTSTFAAFNVADATNTTIYKSNPQSPIPTNNITIVLTYDPVTKIAEGTFSGTALNAGNVAVPITAGKFKAVVP